MDKLFTLRNGGNILGGIFSAAPNIPSYSLVQIDRFQILDTVAVAEASSPYVFTGRVGWVSKVITQVCEEPWWKEMTKTRVLMKGDELRNLFLRGED